MINGVPADIALVPDGALVVHADRTLTFEQAKDIKDYVSQMLPGRTVLILDAGLRLESVDSSARLASIEKKLDVLIEALAMEGTEDDPLKTLEGELFGAPRDQDHPL